MRECEERQFIIDSMLLTKIIVEENSGISRVNEPVTVGIPFPKGLLNEEAVLGLVDPDLGEIRIQTKRLAEWPDGSLKWVLFDFQVSVRARARKELGIVQYESAQEVYGKQIIASHDAGDYFTVDTGRATFYLDAKTFKPFDRVVAGKDEVLDGKRSLTVLTDDAGVEYTPVIEKVHLETEGPLRNTIKIEGVFHAQKGAVFSRFFARLHFFAGTFLTKIDFGIHNPKAAKHPGGLWDLGDPGSVYFQDLSMRFAFSAANGSSSHACYWVDAGPDAGNREPSPYLLPPMSRELMIYQDSSGGENWMSHNHVNRNGEVKHSFRGYRIYEDGSVIEEGNRISPVISVGNRRIGMCGTIRHFWENFPKAIEAGDSSLCLRLFPKHYNDVFELQGGEQKTHVCFLDFGADTEEKQVLQWVGDPLVPHAPPDWYEQSSAFPYLVSEERDPNRDVVALINTAICGENTFIHRREVIDEYGWRNFGELYADHEAVPQKRSGLETTAMTHEWAPQPLVSHYNNQYDCIYGMLAQFARSGNVKWFEVADALCSHVKDIDIYHTDRDRAEFNHGLFWHTEHYLDAGTATHRCFSRRHGDHRELASYGGGPALSHNYSSGLLYHHYMTGDESSMEAMRELSDFTKNNMLMEGTLSNRILKTIKRIGASVRRNRGEHQFADMHKVFGLDGPSRASGNALNTLIDAFLLTKDNAYLARAEELIRKCVGPQDDIEEKDLLDVENRWMYTVFLQALGRYLDVKAEHDLVDDMWSYARLSLINYAEWMLKNECPYLDTPEKLEFPNETWAAQDVRKCNIFLHASGHSQSDLRRNCLSKADFFYEKSIVRLLGFDTRKLTRPIALMMLNGTMYSWWLVHNQNDGIGFTVESSVEGNEKNRARLRRRKRRRRIALAAESQYLRWHIFGRR